MRKVTRAAPLLISFSFALCSFAPKKLVSHRLHFPVLSLSLPLRPLSLPHHPFPALFSLAQHPPSCTKQMQHKNVSIHAFICSTCSA